MISGTKVTFSGLISPSGYGMGVFWGMVLVSLMSTKNSWHLWYNPSKKLVFVPVASSKTGTCRDCLLVACSARRLEV